ncbi:MAG TPA: PIN domain-containing protein [Silvibacterium sp.]|nr:PIN domain-containing protein [Silvibacterium sp.]
MIAYLDTNVVLWLASGALARIRPAARRALERADLLVSPIVLVELEYLFEIERIRISARDAQIKIETEIGVRICDLPFTQVSAVALDEKWTRDPFDRIIVAQAKANGLAPLISADREIAAHYPRTIW